MPVLWLLAQCLSFGVPFGVPLHNACPLAPLAPFGSFGSLSWLNEQGTGDQMPANQPEENRCLTRSRLPTKPPTSSTPALTLEMAQAVIEAYEAAHKPVFLTQDEKSDMASRITIRYNDAKDAVNDVFLKKVATMFIVRRKSA